MWVEGDGREGVGWREGRRERREARGERVWVEGEGREGVGGGRREGVGGGRREGVGGGRREGVGGGRREGVSTCMEGCGDEDGGSEVMWCRNHYIIIRTGLYHQCHSLSHRHRYMSIIIYISLHHPLHHQIHIIHIFLRKGT